MQDVRAAKAAFSLSDHRIGLINSRDTVLSTAKQSGGSKTLKSKRDRTHTGAATGHVVS